MRRKTWIVPVIAGAGLGALAYAAYRPVRDAARVRISTGSRMASTRCGPIEFAESGEGPAVLVIHGAGGGFDQGLDIGQGLVRAGFRVIAPSRFGYLRTPLPADASPEAQADAYASLLDSLEIPNAAIFGVSAGGPSALQFALRFPERTRSLVLLVPAAYAPRPNAAPQARASSAIMFLIDAALRSDFLFWAGSRLAHRTYIRAILGTPPRLLANAPAEDLARVETALNHILPVSSRRAGLLNDALVVSSLPRYALETITARTLTISTEDDGYRTFDGARHTAAHIPDARFIGYPNGGHMLVGWNGAAETEIVAFLKRDYPS